MITIEKYTPCRHAQTIELQVLEDQAQFTVENIGKRLESLKPTELPHLILEDDRVVGFFYLMLRTVKIMTFALKEV